METNNKKYRMGMLGIVFWLGLAIIADLASLIPFVGSVVGPIFWVIFSIYLWKIGCGFVNARRLATGSLSMVAEIIPGIQELPLVVVGVIIVIFMVRAEDKTGISLTPHSGKITKLNGSNARLPEKRVPLNVDGIRMPENK